MNNSTSICAVGCRPTRWPGSRPIWRIVRPAEKKDYYSSRLTGCWLKGLRTSSRPVALVRRVDRKVQAARRRRLLGWAGAAAAAGIIVAVSLWAVQSMFLARGDGREVAQIARNEVAIPEKSTQSGNFPPLQQGGVRPELVATPELPEPPLVAAARVTMIDPTSAIVVPVESHSPNVTLVCIYPTMRAAREEDRPSP